jgi:predicted ATP-grasp superfamily ATP-dependent carboligase
MYPSPYEHAEDFITTVREECVRRDIRVIFPMTEVSAYLILKHRDVFKDIAIPFGTFEAFEFLSDKWRVFEVAEKLGVTAPRTHFIRNGTEMPDDLSQLEFPVVVKPYRSRILLDGRWTATSVQYMRSFSELQAAISRTEYLMRCPFLVQEYILGEGRGIFALYDQGMPVVFFAHRRLREKPPSGGVSVLSESIEVDFQQREAATKILDSAKWHGVAMVEYKVASDGRPYLIEINPRFWGSLQLAIDAGIDFPELLYQLAIGGKLDVANSYKIGTKSRWLLGDLDHLYLTFRNGRSHGDRRASKWKTVIEFLNVSGESTRFEVNRWNDLSPFVFELRQYLRKR